MATVLWKWQARSSGRLDRALTEAIERQEGAWEGEARAVSRSQVQRLIERGHVLANGLPAKAGAKLAPGALVEIRFPEPEPVALVPEERDLEVLYEDEHLLILNKPPGLTVHPSATQKTGTLVHALLHHVKDLSGIGGELRPGIVHRIDKDTSGALVITKTDQAHRKLSDIFSRHAIERVYWAFCYGSPAAQDGKISGRIGRNPSDRKKMTVLDSGGREAVTHYRRAGEYRAQAHARSGDKPFASLLELRLETGRTHQIRVHLTSIGHSIMGDPVYGAPTTGQTKWKVLPDDVKAAIEALPGQALHARVLGFDHPVSGKKIRVEAEPPPGFQELARALEKYR